MTWRAGTWRISVTEQNGAAGLRGRHSQGGREAGEVGTPCGASNPEHWKSYIRQELRQAFAAELRSLTLVELEVFYEQGAFDEYFLPRLIDELRRCVCQVHEFDVYWDVELDAEEIAVKRRVAQKLQLRTRQRNPVTAAR